MVVQIFPIKSTKIIDFGDDVFSVFADSLKEVEIQLEDGDVVAITSKVITMEQQHAVELKTIQPTQQAEEIARDASMDPRVAQLVIDHSNGVLGQVYHAILARTDFGLASNAGIDLSNCPEGWALLLPENPDDTALKYQEKIKKHFGKDVVVILTDSRTIPLRKGAMAVAIGVAGMEPVIDERGNKDLFGYTMVISSRAVADNLANCANLVMGETDEKIPFALIRGAEYHKGKNQTMRSALMPVDQCLYFAPLFKKIQDQ